MLKDTQLCLNVQIYCIELLYLCNRIRITPPVAIIIMFLLFYVLCAISFIPEVFNEKR